MVKKFAAAFAVGAIVAGGAALAPTAASAACWGWGCTYYSYGWAPGVTTATAWTPVGPSRSSWGRSVSMPRASVTSKALLPGLILPA